MGQTVVAKGFAINRHGRLVFPSNAWPRLDFSVFDTVGQLSAAVSRDFEAKAPVLASRTGPGRQRGIMRSPASSRIVAPFR